MNTKKLLALLLALVMILCALPVVYAAAGDSTEEKDSDISVDIEESTDTDDEKVLYGDVNGDGEVTGDDAVEILWHVADPTIILDDSAADVNGDTFITGEDAVRILWHVADPTVVLGPVAE